MDEPQDPEADDEQQRSLDGLEEGDEAENHIPSVPREVVV
jgi:hypothetical protein